MNASDWHGSRSSPSAVATHRSCGGVAEVMKVDSVDVDQVLCEVVWSKRLGGQSRWSDLLSVATYSSCGDVADECDEDDIMVIMVGATGSISGSVA